MILIVLPFLFMNDQNLLNQNELFDINQAKTIMNEEIVRTLTHKKFKPSIKEDIVNEITTTVINRLSTLYNNKYKYITHSIVMTKIHQEFSTFSNNLWNSMKDGVAVVDYKTEELRYIMTVWGVYC